MMDVYGSYTCVGASDSVTDELKVELGPDKVGKLGFKTFNMKVQPPSSRSMQDRTILSFQPSFSVGGQSVVKTGQILRSLLRVGGF